MRGKHYCATCSTAIWTLDKLCLLSGDSEEPMTLFLIYSRYTFFSECTSGDFSRLSFLRFPSRPSLSISDSGIVPLVPGRRLYLLRCSKRRVAADAKNHLLALPHLCSRANISSTRAR